MFRPNWSKSDPIRFLFEAVARSSLCLFCGANTAELLCDHWIGWERKRGLLAKEAPHLLDAPSHLIPIRYRLRHTCDTPLCLACANSTGTMFIRTRHKVFSESMDYCPVPGHERGYLRTEITGLQAQSIRAKWRASIRASREQHEETPRQLGLFSGLLEAAQEVSS